MGFDGIDYHNAVVALVDGAVAGSGDARSVVAVVTCLRDIRDSNVRALASDYTLYLNRFKTLCWLTF
jgi:hypothetical protein